MSNDKRQPGYYRVKYGGEWTIGEWFVKLPTACWFLTADSREKKDEDLEEINETPINPEPEKECNHFWIGPEDTGYCGSCGMYRSVWNGYNKSKLSTENNIQNE